MNLKKIFFVFVALLAVSLLFYNCGGGAVSIKMLEPAQFFFPGVKTVAVSNFSASNTYWNNPAIEFSDALSMALIQNGFYKVVERDRLSNLISEHQLSLSGLTEEGASSQIGQMLGVNAIVTGSISDYSFRDGGEWIKVKRYDREKKENIEEDMFKAFRKARVEVLVRIVDVRTAQIVFSQTYAREDNKNVQRKTKTDAIQALPEGRSMLHGLKNTIVNNFVKSIAPHSVMKRESLMKGKDKRMKDAAKFAMGGLWENAIPIWMDIAQVGIPKDKMAAFYNLAVAHQAQADYDQAINYIDEALKYGSDSMVIRKKSEIAVIKEKREKVIQQLQQR